MLPDCHRPPRRWLSPCDLRTGALGLQRPVPQFATNCMPPPLLLTHWDPDLYPKRAVPLLQELVVHILMHGNVLIKEVDLFLNPRIRSALSKRKNRDAFQSLIDTGYLRILIPDRATVLGLLDPEEQPLLATAREREASKRPLKSEPWRLTEDIERFCKRMDLILGLTARQARNSWARPICRPRVTPPSGENQFAAKLHDVLTQTDRNWQTRVPFKGITPEMADKFARYSQNYEEALRDIVGAGQKPNATNGFYRSLAYQCADLFAEKTGANQDLAKKKAQPMKNLVQSVYAYCELQREKAAGSYSGQRLAEMPPDRKTSEKVVRVEVVPLPHKIPICIDGNIGNVISAVLEECEASLRVFWRLAGTDPAPEKLFRQAWDHVAEAFARHAPVPARRSSGTISAVAEFALRCVALLTESSDPAGGALLQDTLRPLHQNHEMITVACAALDSLRTGRMRLRKQLRKDVNASAGIRCSRIS